MLFESDEREAKSMSQPNAESGLPEQAAEQWPRKDHRKDWERPGFRRLTAGSAEAGPYFNFDGTTFS
jgi:hypothetical protein